MPIPTVLDIFCRVQLYAPVSLYPTSTTCNSFCQSSTITWRVDRYSKETSGSQPATLHSSFMNFGSFCFSMIGGSMTYKMQMDDESKNHYNEYVSN